MPILIVLTAAALFMFGAWLWSERRKRETLLATPLTPHERKIIAMQVPLIERLPDDMRMRLAGKINLFLQQIEFIGCDGLEVTEEMELSIAAQACLLVVNHDAWYNNLRTILIYPGAFKSHVTRQDGFVVSNEKQVRLGESWPRGPEVLSWQHSELGALNDRDGHNLVLHEFAHQFDDLSGHTDGAPLLNSGQSFGEWERVIVAAFERHVKDTDAGKQTVIDPYGAVGIEEFFAVRVEIYFERPLDLKRGEPEVYAQLSELFRMNPVEWD